MPAIRVPRNIVIDLDDAQSANGLKQLAGFHFVGQVGRVVTGFAEGQANSFPSTMVVEERGNDIVIVPYLPEVGAAGDTELDTNWGVDYLSPSGLWQVFGGDGAGVTVGIADSGIDSAHLAFSDLHSIDYAAFDEQGHRHGEAANDTGWHGTHCACILSGTTVGGFRLGVAPKVNLKVARVLTGFTGSVGSIKFGLEWLSQQNCDVVSLSLGRPGLDDAWRVQIERLLDDGVIVIAASGNEYNWTDNQCKTRSPGNYPLPKLISVGAVDRALVDWTRSGGGDITWPPQTAFAGNTVSVPTLSAPGVGIVAAAPGNSYRIEAGTSMATPLVAGIVASILSILRRHNVPNEREVAVSILKKALKDYGAPGRDNRYGLGLIDSTLLKSALEDVLPL